MLATSTQADEQGSSGSEPIATTANSGTRDRHGDADPQHRQRRHAPGEAAVELPERDDPDAVGRNRENACGEAP